eukprot:Rhum_TRINITY_DN5780_c0_g1::Rhum_TRINITY_DN5780_c0_g1_i1::g.18301::m.18301
MRLRVCDAVDGCGRRRGSGAAGVVDDEARTGGTREDDLRAPAQLHCEERRSGEVGAGAAGVPRGTAQQGHRRAASGAARLCVDVPAVHHGAPRDECPRDPRGCVHVQHRAAHRRCKRQGRGWCGSGSAGGAGGVGCVGRDARPRHRAEHRDVHDVAGPVPLPPVGCGGDPACDALRRRVRRAAQHPLLRGTRCGVRRAPDVVGGRAARKVGGLVCSAFRSRDAGAVPRADEAARGSRGRSRGRDGHAADGGQQGVRHEGRAKTLRSRHGAIVFAVDVAEGRGSCRSYRPQCLKAQGGVGLSSVV